MKRIVHKIEGKEVVHYEGCLGDSYALCGMNVCADDALEMTDSVVTTKRVTCEDCLRVRDHVLGRPPRTNPKH